MNQGPPLAALVRRLAETPAEFLGSPDVAAVVSDLVHDLGGGFLAETEAAVFTEDGDARRLALVLVAAWLLHDEWFLGAARFAPAALAFLSHGLDDLVALVAPPQFVSDPDRREELARLVLAALGLVPDGESDAQAADRLTTLDSRERVKVLRETRAAQERIRRVQEAMKKKAAEEAAAAYGRE